MNRTTISGHMYRAGIFYSLVVYTIHTYIYIYICRYVRTSAVYIIKYERIFLHS